MVFSYVPSTLENDIALVKLNEKWTKGSVDLCKAREKSTNGLYTVIGMGATKPPKDENTVIYASKVLQSAVQEEYDQSDTCGSQGRFEETVALIFFPSSFQTIKLAFFE